MIAENKGHSLTTFFNVFHIENRANYLGLPLKIFLSGVDLCCQVYARFLGGASFARVQDSSCSYAAAMTRNQRRFNRVN